MSHLTFVLSNCSTMLLMSSMSLATELSGIGRTITPDQVQWQPNPHVPGLGVARIISKRTEPGPYVYRAKFPPGRVVQAHSHPDDRTYTVISGILRIGWCEKYRESTLITLRPGSFYAEPTGVPHFVASPDGEAIVQITGTGPTKAACVDPAHAPRKI